MSPTTKAPGRTPKPVGKKKNKGSGEGGGSSLPPLGPKPTVGKLPQGRLTPGDKRFVGKQGAKLRAARKEGVAAATSQLEGIVSGVGKQGRKLTKESNRVIAGMNRLAENEQAFQRRQRRGVEIDTQSILGRTSATGARSGYMDMGITAGRRRQSIAGAKLSGALSEAAIGQAKGTKKAGQRAFQSIKAAEKKAAGDSMTILEVLDAERASEDQRFLTEMRYNIRSQRMQQQFQLMMANLGFEQDIYKMRLENRLAADYLEWQHENGYLMKPEEQAALDWKYKKKKLDYAYRASQKDKDPAAAAKWDAYNTAITDAITETNAALSDPETMQTMMQSAQTAVETGGAASLEQALYGQFAYSQDALPQNIDAGVVNTVVRQMIENRVAGDMGSPAAGGVGWAPNFETIRDTILTADSDGTVTQYVDRHPGQLEQAHMNYRMISAAAVGVDKERNRMLTTDSGGFPVGATVAAGTTATVGAGIVGAVKRAGRLGTEFGAEVAEEVASQFKGVTPEDLIGVKANTVAANASVAGAAQQGRISPFMDPMASGVTRNATFLRGARAIGTLGVSLIPDLALAALAKTNPKLYMEITNPYGIVSQEVDEAVTSQWEQEHMN